MSIRIARIIFLLLQVYYTLERPGSKKTLVSKHSRRNLVDKNMLAGMKYFSLRSIYFINYSRRMVALPQTLYEFYDRLLYRSEVIQLRLQTRAQGA